MVGYARLYCKGWSFPYCGPRKALAFIRQVTRQAKKRSLSRFLTLTLNPKYLPDEGQVPYIRNVWRKFRVYMKRKTGETVSFISVLEFQKSGRPHMHVLIDQYLHQGWVSNTWDRLGGGKIVHIERVKDLGKIGWYLGKYLTKEMVLSAPKGMRRYSSSRNIKLWEPKESSGWELVNASMDVLYEKAKGIVEEVIDENGYPKFFAIERGVEEEAFEEIGLMPRAAASTEGL